MLQADPEPAGAYLPRALSAAWADEREIAFLVDVRGAGTAALVDASRVRLLGPLGAGFDIQPGPAVLVGGGIGAAILPWLARAVGDAAPRRAGLPQRGARRLRRADRSRGDGACSTRCWSPSRWRG